MTTEFNQSQSSMESGTPNDAVGTIIAFDDCRSYHSDCSVGDITETSISDETESERQLVSALATTLVAQQQDISDAFATMVSKMAFMIDEKETENERLQGKFSEESQQRRQEQAEKCTKAVNSLAKKQAKISRQLEKLVFQLEESNREKDLERVQLKKQVQSMKERMQKMKSSLDLSSSSRGINVTKNRLSRPPSGRSQSFRVQPQLPQEHYIVMNESATPEPSCSRPEACDVPREISFMSTIVDISEMTKLGNNDDTTVSSSMDDLQNTGDNVRLIL